MIFQGRLTRDAELRYSGTGAAVANLNFVYSYGMKKEGQQYKPSQFVRAVMFGQQAERLIEYLKKGSRFLVVLDDVHVEPFQKQSGETSYNLEGKIIKIEFLNTGENQAQGNDQQPRQAPQQQQAPRQQPNAYEQQSRGGGLVEPDDIPFNQMGGRKGHYL